ncbi:MAG TPA: shikimate kinase, partial [Pseudobdellovibrionaceae bacterium]|nr:shikimate kinase [Pseudobdellovibrionaceae bacterium]
MNKIILLIGHRGVGKSELAQRWKNYESSSLSYYDLDQEIEKTIGKSIEEIFKSEGEGSFRKYEKEVFFKLIQQINENKNYSSSHSNHVRSREKSILCLGAGFDLEGLEFQNSIHNFQIVWVQRTTDREGRIFLNRPRLNQDLSPLTESIHRYHERNSRFNKVATECYLMPEGLIKKSILGQHLEKQILCPELDKKMNYSGFITVTPNFLSSEYNWLHFLERYKNRNITFEFRDDLLTSIEIEKAVNSLVGEKCLYSFRAHAEYIVSKKIQSKINSIDWPMELGLNLQIIDFLKEESLHKKVILSQHDRLNVNWEAPENLKNIVHLKASPVVDNFVQFESLYNWWKINPKERSLLPRSSEGRWTWFRLRQKNKQWINFWREGTGSSPDQPSLFQWLSMPDSSEYFAAVLGSPVNHSFSPLEHLDEFSKKKVPFLAIDLNQSEWLLAIDLLKTLGLKWAAVTSPLKELAAQLLNTNDKAVNTLYFDNKNLKWMGISTDELGLKYLIQKNVPYASHEIIVWGGGGVLSAFKKILSKDVCFYSARTGQIKSSDSEMIQNQNKNPKVVIWAAP